MSGSDSGADPLGSVAEAFLAELRAGGRPTPEGYAARHPGLADRIRALFPMLVEMERLVPPSAAPAPDPGPAPAGPGPGYIGDYRLLREIGRGGWGSSTRRCRSRSAATSR